MVGTVTGKDGIELIMLSNLAMGFLMMLITTLGYGDVVLDSRWRLLASFEAANGIIMFGWTTAIVVSAVQRVYAAAKS